MFSSGGAVAALAVIRQLAASAASARGSLSISQPPCMEVLKLRRSRLARIVPAQHSPPIQAGGNAVSGAEGFRHVALIDKAGLCSDLRARHGRTAQQVRGAINPPPSDQFPGGAAP